MKKWEFGCILRIWGFVPSGVSHPHLDFSPSTLFEHESTVYLFLFFFWNFRNECLYNWTLNSYSRVSDKCGVIFRNWRDYQCR